MNITDKLKYYIGCEVQTPDGIETFVSMSILGGRQNYSTLRKFMSTTKLRDYSEIKPILRKLDSMTEEEAIELCKMQIRGFRDNEDQITIIQMSPVVKFIVHHKSDDGDEKLHCTRRYLNIESYLVNQFHYLISKGFWIFEPEAFEDGHIIEKTI